MKILIIALSGIGDALMFTPALQKLKEEIPSASIDALVMYKGVNDIYNNLPQFDNVLHFDFLKSPRIKSLRYVLSLRNRYDAAINVYPSNRREYNFISLLIGAGNRLAVKYLRKDFSNFGFLNSARILEDDNLHNVEENIRMVEELTGTGSSVISPLLLVLDKHNIDYAQNFLAGNSVLADDLVIGFHPGCSSLKNHERRRWEPAKFAKLGVDLIEKSGAKILVFGGGEENELKNSIVSSIGSPMAIAVNASNLSDTAAVMKRCNLFVTNDSSLMHIASALKLNVIALLGPTNSNYIRPWQTEHRIASLNLDCSPCFYYSPKPLSCSRRDLKFKCIKELPVELVMKECEGMIRKSDCGQVH